MLAQDQEKILFLNKSNEKTTLEGIFKNKKTVIIQFSNNIPEHVILSYLDSVLDKKNYLNILNKQMFLKNSNNLDSISTFLINNRIYMFNQNSRLKMVIKNNKINYKTFIKDENTNFNQEDFFIDITKTKIINFKKDHKIIFLCNDIKTVFSKKILEILLKKELLIFLKIDSINSNIAELLFYKKF